MAWLDLRICDTSRAPRFGGHLIPPLLPARRRRGGLGPVFREGVCGRLGVLVLWRRSGRCGRCDRVHGAPEAVAPDDFTIDSHVSPRGEHVGAGCPGGHERRRDVDDPGFWVWNAAHFPPLHVCDFKCGEGVTHGRWRNGGGGDPCDYGRGWDDEGLEGVGPQDCDCFTDQIFYKHFEMW